MILKLWHDSAWHYFGDVLDLTAASPRKRNSSQAGGADKSMTTTWKDKKEEKWCKWFVVRRRGGEVFSICTDSSDVYLCDASGDTIQRF